MRCSPLLHPSPQVLTEDQHPHPPPWRRATCSSGPQARTPVEDTRSCRTGTPETQSSRELTSSAHFLPSLPDRWGPRALGRGPAQTTTCRKGLALSSGFRADLTLLPRHSLLCQALPRKQLLWPKPRTHRGLSGKQSQNPGPPLERGRVTHPGPPWRGGRVKHPGPPWRGAESCTLARVRDEIAWQEWCWVFTAEESECRHPFIVGRGLSSRGAAGGRKDSGRTCGAAAGRGS